MAAARSCGRGRFHLVDQQAAAWSTMAASKKGNVLSREFPNFDVEGLTEKYRGEELGERELVSGSVSSG